MVSTTFPDLPNELLHHIISYLHPYHQFDVALSCRTFYHVVRPSFQTHKVNYAEYGRIHLYGGGGDNGEWYEPGDGPEQPCAITPYSLLDRLLKKPDRIKYVAELRIQKNATDMLEGATSAYPLPDVFFRIKASVLENDFLGDWKEGPPGSLVGSLTESEKREAKLLWILADMYDERRLIPALDRGCAGVALGHLLCLCRELRQLKFAPYREQEWVAQALHRIGRAYEEMRDKAGKSRLRDPVRLGLPLENLRRVELRHWDTNGYVNFIWVRLFVELPNLREFRGHMIGLTETNYTGERRCGAGDIGAREECHEGSSNVEELTFSSSAVEPGDWLLLLGSIAALEKFEYECGGVIVERVDWDAHQVIHALEHSAKRTLKCLRLWDGETMEDNNLVPYLQWITSLKNFEVLETLCCNWRDIVLDPVLDFGTCDGEQVYSGPIQPEGALADGFYPQESEGEFEIDLGDILPTSLKYLGIRNCPEEDFEVVEKLLKSGLERLPNLQGICISGQEAETFQLLARQNGLQWKPSLLERDLTPTSDWMPE